MADGKRKLEVVITGDSRGLERAFGKSAKASDSFGRRLGKGAGKGMLLLGGAAAAGAVAGVAAVGIGLVKAGKAAADAEASNARLGAQLRTLGKDNAAVRGNIEKTVQSLSMMSGFDDEDLQDAFTNLVRSSGNVAKSQKDLALITDMAASGQVNLSTATKLINRVNNGSITSLKRYGIQVDENTTKEQAMAMLREKFAGQAKAYGETAAGAQARLGVAMENAFEQVGVALTPLIVEFSNLATKYLPGIAKAASQYLGQAIAWIKTNWPQIRAVLSSVWDWYRTYVQSVVVPIFKGIISGIGALVGFIRDHMPQIRAAAQAAFGWIQTNIVPTVRTVATVVAGIVRGMATVWREHGEDIKRIVGPVFNTIKTVIRGALIIIREVVEMTLALIRGDFGEVFSSLGTIVKTALGVVKTVMLTGLNVLKAIAGIIGREIVEFLADKLSALRDKVAEKFNAAKAAVREAAGALATAAADIGRRIVDGIINGLGSLYSRVKSKLESDLKSVIDKLNPFSPVEHGGEIVAKKLADGMVSGLNKNKSRVAQSLSATVRQAVQSARANLGSLTSGLAGMLGTAFAAAYRNARGKTLGELNADRDANLRAREKARLDADQTAAKSEVDRLEAIADKDEETNQQLADARQRLADADVALADWAANEEIRLAEEAVAGKQAAYERDIANLTAAFNAGDLSAQQFRDQLNALIGGETGASIGGAFAAEFKAQLDAVFAQITALANAGAVLGVAGPDVQRPGSVSNKELAEWRERRKKRLDQLEDNARKKDTPGKEKITPAEREAINAAMEKWDKNNPKPKALAMGGVLRGAVLAGEAGPEAVLPLNSGRAQRMLATALDGADRINGRSGGGTTIVVNVQGNEISARDFARRLKPELDRLVGFGQV